MEENISESTLQWSEKIKSQMLSGKNAVQWCREQDIPYSTFAYWRKRLQKNNPSQNSKSSQFIELPQESSTAWVEITLPGAKIIISKEVNLDALLFCLQLLGRPSC